MMINHGRKMAEEITFIHAFAYWKGMNMGNAPTLDAKEIRTVAKAWAEQCADESFDEATVIKAVKEITKRETFYPSWKAFYDVCMEITPHRYHVAMYNPNPYNIGPHGEQIVSLAVTILVDEGMTQDQIDAVTGRAKYLGAGPKAIDAESESLEETKAAYHRMKKSFQKFGGVPKDMIRPELED